jgi:ABC-type transporter MlaC component
MKTLNARLGLFLIALLSFPILAEEPASEKPAAPAATTAPAVEVSPEKRDTTTKTYTGEALKLKDQMIGLFAASEKVNSAAEKSKARGIIETAVDWDRIAKTCLGAEWKKQSAPNREKFQKLLKEVILKTAFSRMDTFWDGTSYKFDKIDVTGKEAKVRAKFKVKEDFITIDYHMNKKGEKWLMHDVVYDDLVYSQVVNEKVSTFLKEGKFAGLLDSLRKRLDELEKDASDSKKS